MCTSPPQGHTPPQAQGPPAPAADTGISRYFAVKKDTAMVPRAKMLALEVPTHRSFLPHMPEMLRSGDYADVVVRAGGNSVRAHRVVVAAASGKLGRLLSEAPSDSGGMHAVDLDEMMGGSSDTLISIMEYIYTGQCDVTPAAVLNVYDAAKRAQLLSLARVAERRAALHITTPTCLAVLLTGRQHSSALLTRTATDHLAAHFLDVAFSPAFVALDDHGIIAAALASPLLHIADESENALCDALLGWTQRKPFERILALRPLLDHVRFGLVSPDYMRHLLIHHPLTHQSNDIRRLLQTHLDHHEQLINGVPPPSPHWRLRRCPNTMTANTLYQISGAAVSRFDSASQAWQPLAPPRDTRNCAAAVPTQDGSVIVVGGDNPSGCLNTCERLDPATNTWSVLPPMSTPRSAGAATSHGSRIFAVGGFDGVNDTDIVECLCITTTTSSDTSTTPSASYRSLSTAITLRSSPPASPTPGYTSSPPLSPGRRPGSPSTSEQSSCCGSVNSASSSEGRHHQHPHQHQPQDQIVPYETSAPKPTWATLPPLAHRRHGLGCAVVDGTLYAVGGITSTTGTSVSTVEELCVDVDVGPHDDEPALSSLSWRPCTPLSSARGGLVVISLGGYLYAIGGQGPAPMSGPPGVGLMRLNDSTAPEGGSHTLGTVERFDPISRRWESVASMRSARSYAAGTVVGGHIVVSGGVDSEGRLVEMAECYDPVTDTWELLPAVGVAGGVSEHALVAIS